MNAREQRSDALHEEHYEKDIRPVMDNSDTMDKDDMEVKLKKQKLIHGFQKNDAPRKYNPTQFDTLQFNQTTKNQTVNIEIPEDVLESLNKTFIPQKSEAGVIEVKEASGD